MSRALDGFMDDEDDDGPVLDLTELNDAARQQVALQEKILDSAKAQEAALAKIMGKKEGITQQDVQTIMENNLAQIKNMIGMLEKSLSAPGAEWHVDVERDQNQKIRNMKFKRIK